MYKVILVFLGVRQVILGFLCYGNENDRWGFHYGNSVMCLIRVYNLYFLRMAQWQTLVASL